MEKKYFTVTDVDKLIYFQMPKVLIYGDKYKKLSNDAKLLYMLTFDFIKISMSNHGKKDKYGSVQYWKDENGFYIKLSVAKIMEIMQVGRTKAINLKNELEKFNLLEQKRQMNKTNLLYVLQVDYTEEDIYTVNNTHENAMESGDKPSEDKEVRKTNHGGTENVLPEVQNPTPNKNESIKTKSIKNLKEKNEEEDKYIPARARENNSIQDLEIENQMPGDMQQPKEESTPPSNDEIIENEIWSFVEYDKNYQYLYMFVIDKLGFSPKQALKLFKYLKKNEWPGVFHENIAVKVLGKMDLATKDAVHFFGKALITEETNAITVNKAFKSRLKIQYDKNNERPKGEFYNWLEIRD